MCPAIVLLVRTHRFDHHRTMPHPPDLAAFAAVLADRSRAAMLLALMDGRALTATELATAGEVAASTASSHLGRLVEAGWLDVVRQGRHRYFRLRDAGAASLLEQLMTQTSQRVAPVAVGPADAALRRARVCYDHLAGSCGTQLFERLYRSGCLATIDDAPVLTPDGEAWCIALGVDVAALRGQRRPLCRSCLDWSERRPHLAGALGAALLARLLERGVLRRQAQGRALTVTAGWERLLDRLAVPA
jgi:DNA-binding transcriptional ArsR family regulator